MTLPFVTGTAVYDELARLGLIENTFDDLVDHGRSLVASPVALIDEFEDATGIDAANSTGETWNAAGYVSNPAPGYSSDLVPTMTGNTTPNGTASATSEGSGQEAFKALDDASGTLWGSTAQPSGGSPQELIYEFASSETITKYTVQNGTSGTAYPADWTFEGWTGAAWVVLDTVTGSGISGSGATLTRDANDFTNSTSYIKYKLNITANGGHSGTVQVAEWQMMESLAPPALDLRSLGTTVAAGKTSGFFVGKFSETDPDTVYASIDGGTTWDAVTLTDQGDHATGISLFSGPVNFSASGTDARLRVEKAAGTELRTQAWGLVL